MQRVANTSPDIDGAKCFIENALRSYIHKEWWGPVTDALALFIGLTEKETTTSEGERRTYFVFLAPYGSVVLAQAAIEHPEAYLLAKHVVSSLIQAEQLIPIELRDFAALALIDRFPAPPEKKGAKKRTKWNRDVALNKLMSEVKDRFGIVPAPDTSKNEKVNSSISLIMSALDAERFRPEDVRSKFRGLTPEILREIAASDMTMRAVGEAIDKLGPWFRTYVERVHGEIFASHAEK